MKPWLLMNCQVAKDSKYINRRYLPMKKIIFFSIIAFSLNLYASPDINLDEEGEQIQTDTVSTVNIGLQSDKTISVVMPKQSEEEQSLIEKLNHARKVGDRETARTLLSELDAIHGIVTLAPKTSSTDTVEFGESIEVQKTMAQTLSGDILVNDPSEDVVNPSLVSTPEGILYVAMAERTDNDLYIYRSDNNGNTWTRVWHVTSTGENPSLAYAKGNIYMAYENINNDDARDVKVFRVSVADKLDNSFSTVSSNIVMNGADDHIVPRIISDAEHWSTVPYLYVTYSTFAIDHYPVFYSRSTDDGATWSTPTNITGGSENTSFPGNPDIIYGYTSSHFIYVAFNKPGWNGTVWQPQIWATRSVNFGTWSTPIQLTDYYYESIKPRIESANGKTMVGWLYNGHNDGSAYHIYYHSSGDNGATWQLVGAISNITGQSENGFELTHSTNKFHVSYTNGSLHDLMYRNIPTVDIGNSTKWTSPIQADANKGYVSRAYPWSSIVVPPNSNEKACFTWSDFRNGQDNYGIYFNRVSTPFSPSIIMYLLN